jgi:integrase
MRLYKRNGIYHYAFTIDGQRYRKSAATSDKRLAEDIAHAHEAKIRRAAVHGPEAVLTFADALGLYVDEGRDTRFLAPLLDHFGKTLVARITPPMLRDAAYKLYPNASAATRNRQVITPARAVINAAAERGLCPPIRCKLFKTARVKRPAGTREWIDAFANAARADGKPELAACALFIFTTGARIGQALTLTWNEISLVDGTAILTTRKTGAGGPEARQRSASLVPALVAAIASFEPRHPRLVFGYPGRQTFFNHWDRVIERAGLVRLTSHEAGRHGFGTELVVRNNVDVVTAAELGGWQSPRMLLDVYAHPEEGRALIMDIFAGKKARG